MKGFIAFMNKWGVIGLAIAVIIGGKLNAWVSALVEDIICLLYTSDAADERSSVDLGGRRILKKKNS